MAAMHRSDSAIFRFRFGYGFCVRPLKLAISPVLKPAVSKAFTASRFFFELNRCQAMLLLLSASL